MNWLEESLTGELTNLDRDRSTIFVGAFPERDGLKLWRCYGAEDEIYREVCKVRVANGAKLPHCEFDSYSYHYALMDGKQTVGVMTITRPDDGTVECEAYYPQTLLSVFREDLLTSCRFMMLPSAKSGYSLLRWMTTSVWKDHVGLGCRGAVINVQDEMVLFYRRMGFRVLDGFAFTHPALGTSSQVMTLRADPMKQPFFREAFEQLKSVIPARIWNRVLESSSKQRKEETAIKPRGKIYSYAAGSNSMEPHGYRVVDNTDSSRIGEVCILFPSLAGYFCDMTMILVAYPATLGLCSPGVLVDSYVHVPTFIRSLHLAAVEQRPVVVVAQPLVGADFILRAIRQGIPMPKRMLWASGGYYLPESLERTVRENLLEAGCSLEVLHCYGTAEIGHSLFVAVDRLASGRPHYQKAAEHIAIKYDELSGRLTILANSGSQALEVSNHGPKAGNKELEDSVRIEGDGFDIIPHPNRLSPLVFQELESWNKTQWARWTGNLAYDSGDLIIQCRQGVLPGEGFPNSNYQELEYHQYFAKYGGSILEKPRWGDYEINKFRSDSSSVPALAFSEPSDEEPNEGRSA